MNLWYNENTRKYVFMIDGTIPLSDRENEIINLLMDKINKPTSHPTALETLKYVKEYFGCSINEAIEIYKICCVLE